MVPMADGLVSVMGQTEKCPVINTPIRQLSQLFPDLNIVIGGIIRNDKGILPRSHEHVTSDDVYFVYDSSHLSRAMSAFGHEEEEGRNVIVLVAVILVSHWPRDPRRSCWRAR